MPANTSHDVLKHLTALVAFDTQNPPRAIRRGGIDRYVSAVLEQVGFDVIVDDVAPGCLNILAVRGQPHLLYHVHLDTVPAADDWTTDPWTLQTDDEKAVGLGACDIKGGAAALLTTFSHHPEIEAAILFTTDEEAGSSRCVRAFLASGHAEQFDRVVVAEPTGNRAVLSHRGLVTLQVTATGQAGHSSTADTRPDTSASAIHQLVAWLHESLQYVNRFELQRSGQDASSLRFNIGVIEGGLKPNMIAASASARCGFRPPPDVDAASVLHAFQEIAARLGRITIAPGFDGPALSEHEAARRLADRTGLEIAEPAQFWTEAGLFAAAGFPAFVVGPGDIAQAHTADEFVSIRDLEQAIGVYRALATNGSNGSTNPSTTSIADTGALAHERNS